MVHGHTLDLQADGMGMYFKIGTWSLLWISRGKSRISRRNTLRHLGQKFFGSFETGDGLGKPMKPFKVSAFLGVVLKHFFFSPLREMIQFDLRILFKWVAQWKNLG